MLLPNLVAADRRRSQVTSGLRCLFNRTVFALVFRITNLTPFHHDIQTPLKHDTMKRTMKIAVSPKKMCLPPRVGQGCEPQLLTYKILEVYNFYLRVECGEAADSANWQIHSRHLGMVHDTHFAMCCCIAAKSLLRLLFHLHLHNLHLLLLILLLEEL